MIILDTGDKIQGDATNASEVDFLISGVEKTTSANTLKNLADGQLPAAKGDLYVAPASTTTIVNSITLVNTGAAHNHVNLYLLPAAGTARRFIAKDLALGIGYSLYTDGTKVIVMDTDGNILPVPSLSLSTGIADNDFVAIDSADVADDEYARFTAFGLEGRTKAEVITDLLGVALPENVEIQLTSTLSADGKYSGIVISGIAGATLAFGDLVYFAVLDSRWELADADAEATAFGVLGICVLAAANDGSATKILLFGKVRADTAFPSLTIGAPVFVSTDAGDITNTAPSGAADIIRIVGWGLTADVLFFFPDQTYIEHV